jgi:hypothetical protein
MTEEEIWKKEWKEWKDKNNDKSKKKKIKVTTNDAYETYFWSFCPNYL